MSNAKRNARVAARKKDARRRGIKQFHFTRPQLQNLEGIRLARARSSAT